jgi:hypothetical protein
LGLAWTLFTGAELCGKEDERRDPTKGQKAMQLALLYPEPDKRGRGNKGKQRRPLVLASSDCVKPVECFAHSRDLAIAVRDCTVRFTRVVGANGIVGQGKGRQHGPCVPMKH